MGVFIRAAVNDNISSKQEKLLLNWIGNNADKDGLDKVTSSMELKATKDSKKDEYVDDTEAWQDLAEFFGGI